MSTTARSPCVTASRSLLKLDAMMRGTMTWFESLKSSLSPFAFV